MSLSWQVEQTGITGQVFQVPFVSRALRCFQPYAPPVDSVAMMPASPLKQSRNKQQREIRGPGFPCVGPIWHCRGRLLIGRQNFTCRNQEMSAKGRGVGSPWLLLFGGGLAENIWLLCSVFTSDNLPSRCWQLSSRSRLQVSQLRGCCLEHRFSSLLFLGS